MSRHESLYFDLIFSIKHLDLLWFITVLFADFSSKIWQHEQVKARAALVLLSLRFTAHTEERHIYAC